MPQPARAAQQRRLAAANRARAALPKRRRATAAETLARRGTVALGVIVVVALIVGAIATYDAGGRTALPVSNATADRRGDPNALIAAVTANPQSADALVSLADYYARTGQSANALPLYQRYLQLRPNDTQARVSTGELLLSLGDTAGSQTQFAQVIALKPDARTVAEAHLGLGNAYTALTPPRLSAALDEFTTAADLDPNGEIGSAARDRLASIQAQYGIATVTVAAPTVPVVTQP